VCCCFHHFIRRRIDELIQRLCMHLNGVFQLSACYECHGLKAQMFHTLWVLRGHGLNKDALEAVALEGVFKAVVIAKLTYASHAWWGFTTAHDWQKMESVIRRGVRFGYCTTNQAPLSEHVAEADETLFKNILHIKQHVLHQLLPDRTQSTYNLCSRKHDCSLTVKHSVTANEFITRMLYKDTY